MSFAKTTSVPVGRTQEEIKKTLTKDEKIAQERANYIIDLFNKYTEDV